MTKNIYWVLECNVKEGQLENVKSLMDEMVKYTNENEPGALFYEWNISEDEKTLVLHERYSDAEATLKHMNSFGKNFAQKFMSLLDVKRFNVFGDVNDDARKVLGSVGARFFGQLGGFQR